MGCGRERWTDIASLVRVFFLYDSWWTLGRTGWDIVVLESRACGDHVPSLSVRFGSWLWRMMTRSGHDMKNLAMKIYAAVKGACASWLEEKMLYRMRLLPFFICCQSYLFLPSKLNWYCNIEVMCRRWLNGKAKIETKLTNFIKVKRKI